HQHPAMPFPGSPQQAIHRRALLVPAVQHPPTVAPSAPASHQPPAVDQGSYGCERRADRPHCPYLTHHGGAHDRHHARRPPAPPRPSAEARMPAPPPVGPMRHDETMITAAGSPVRAYRAGAGPTLVLLHGGGLDDAQLSWAPVWPALTGHAQLLAPDLPGYG